MRIGIGQIKSSLGALGACPGSPLDVQTVYNLARSAGFTPDVARSMVAIAQRESGLNPSCLATSVMGSTEASYGLWQINMSGAMRPQKLAMFGLSDPSQLLDPTTNAMAAYRLSGGGNLSPWHIDSDVGNIVQSDGSVKSVNLGYRTKYLSFLSALPSLELLEASFAGTDSITEPESDISSNFMGDQAPSLTSDIAWVGAIGLAAWLFWR